MIFRSFSARMDETPKMLRIKVPAYKGKGVKTRQLFSSNRDSHHRRFVVRGCCSYFGSPHFRLPQPCGRIKPRPEIGESLPQRNTNSSFDSSDIFVQSTVVENYVLIGPIRNGINNRFSWHRATFYLNLLTTRSSPLLERHIHQQLVAFNVDDVTERPFSATCEVKSHAAATDAHVANAQMVQKFRQRRIHDVQLFPMRAGTDAQHRHQNEKYSARGPRLRRAGNRILHRL